MTDPVDTTRFCFTCLGRDDKLTNFQEPNHNNLTYMQMLQITIPEMGFISVCSEALICDRCKSFVDDIYSFREMCMRNKRTLRKYIHKFEGVTIVKDTTEVSDVINLDSDDSGQNLLYTKGETEFEIQSVMAATEIVDCDDGVRFINNNFDYVVMKGECDGGDFEEDYKEECYENGKSEDDGNAVGYNVLENTSFENLPYELNENGDEEDIPGEKLFIITTGHKFAPSDTTPDTIPDTTPFQDPIESDIETKPDTIKLESNNLCKICYMTFDDRVSAFQHKESHRILGFYICTCERKFKSYKAFVAHKRAHDYKPYKCKVCGLMFMDVGKLARHKERAHKVFGDRKEEKVRAVRKEVKIEAFYCSLCKRGFGALAHLRNHERFHKVKKIDRSEGRERGAHRGGLYSCRVCGKGFIELKSLKQHVAYHNRLILKKCTKCEKTFTHSRDLRQHQRIHSDLLSCKTCGKRFKRAGNLKEHKKIHVKDVKPAKKLPKPTKENKPHVCKFCGRVFQRSYTLQVHEYLRHRKAEPPRKVEPLRKAGRPKVPHVVTPSPWMCRYCKKTFSNATNLVRHERGHAPLICRYCNKKFDSVPTRLEHEHNHPMKTYKCRHCVKHFQRMKDARQHEHTHNPRGKKKTE